jgi:hypothetical protein
MSWLKTSDTAAMNPRVLAVASVPGASVQDVNAVYGFVHRCAVYCAQYRGDYVIEPAAYITMGFGDHERLIDLAVQVGLMFWVEDEAGVRSLHVLDDEDNFVHMLSPEENEWAAQRNRDNRDWTLKGPVLLRDGDNCRYCGVRVTWTGRKTGQRRGTLDHRVPGEPGTVDTLVVACRRCNSSRGEDESGAWDRAHPLLPVPAHPVWGKWTRRNLVDNGFLDDVESHGDAADGRSDRASGAPSVGVASGSVDAPVGVGVPVGSEGNRGEVDPGAPDQCAPEGPSPRDPARERDSVAGEAVVFKVASSSPPLGGERIRELFANRDRMPRVTDSNASGRAGTGRAGTGQAGTGQAGTGQAGTGQAGTGQAGTEGASLASEQKKRKRRRRSRR